MIINKSQCQLLSRVGLLSLRLVFIYGQLAVDHCNSCIKVISMDKEGNLSNTTINVVCKEVLQGLYYRPLQ